MPSKKVLEVKQAAVAALADKMKDASAGVLVSYQGIKVEDDTKMRAALRSAGVEYCVMKNTLTGKACDIVGYGDMKQYLSGMTAIAISKDDPIAPAKILCEYAEKIDNFHIRSGFLDGAVIESSTITELSKIPPKEQLIAKMLGSLMAPISNLCFAVKAVADKMEASETAPAAEAAPAEAPAQA